MSDTQLLTAAERSVLAQLAQEKTIDGRRAAALLALDEGQSQAETAVLTGLTIGQVKYARSKFAKMGLAVFASAAETGTTSENIAEEETGEDGRLQTLVSELDGLLSDLKSTLPDANTNPYSPFHLLTMIRDNISTLTPDVQLGMLESFKEMTVEDLKDIETWKGMAYMLNYSAQFQANQMKEKLNEQMPSPLKPDRIIGFMKQSIDRFTPALAKDIFQNFQGTTKEDWVDPETWKGMWYMINYSLQFQAEQLKQRLVGEAPEE